MNSACLAGDENTSDFNPSARTPAMRSSRTVVHSALRHSQVISERTKVSALQWKIKKETHHERRTETIFGRIDAALDEERCTHAQRDVERRYESQVKPVRAFSDDPFAERKTN